MSCGTNLQVKENIQILHGMMWDVGRGVLQVKKIFKSPSRDFVSRKKTDQIDSKTDLL